MPEKLQPASPGAHGAPTVKNDALGEAKSAAQFGGEVSKKIVASGRHPNTIMNKPGTLVIPNRYLAHRAARDTPSLPTMAFNAVKNLIHKSKSAKPQND